MTWLLSSISDQVAFWLRPLTTTVASVLRKVLLPAFAFLTVSSVALIAVTVPPNTSCAAGRCTLAGFAAAVAVGAAMAPVAGTPAKTPAVAIPANTLPIISETTSCVFDDFDRASVAPPGGNARGTPRDRRGEG